MSDDSKVSIALGAQRRIQMPSFLNSNSVQTRRRVLLPQVLAEMTPDVITQARDSEEPGHFAVETAIGKMSLEAFVEKYEEYRNWLAEQKMRGTQLSATELFVLKILNQCLDQLVGFKPSPEHEAAVELAKEARRRLSRG